MRLLGPVVVLAVASMTAATAAATKVPLGYAAYDGWKSIRGTVLSDDGVYLAYSLVPEDGDATLVVRNLESGVEQREPRGIAPAFTPDSRTVLYTIAPPKAEIDVAKRLHKRPDDQPKSGLGILTLSNGAVQTFDRVRSWKIARHGSRFIGFLFEPPISPGKLPSPTPSPAAAPPQSDAKKKASGAMLAIRDLLAGSNVNIDGVTEFALSPDDRFVAYSRESKDGDADGVRVRTLPTGATRDIVAGAGRYTKVTFAPESDRLAFLSDRDTYANAAPSFAVYALDASEPAAAARAAVAAAAKGMPVGFAPSDNAELTFSKDGNRLYFGTAPAPTPQASGTPEPTHVDLWNWRDEDLQSAQKHDAEDERKRTYLAVLHFADDRFVQLGSPSLRDVTVNENGNTAVGFDDRAYRRSASWETDFSDEYAVSLRDGSRRLLATKVKDRGILSPDGRYVVGFDRTTRAWLAIRTSDGARRDLTSALRVPFYDELDDHPAPPPPYEFGGWTDGDRYVLLCDRFDVWAVDPGTGVARNLTADAGRKAHLRLQPLQLDPERTAFSLDRPVLLDAFNDDTKDSGLYEVSLREPAAFAPRQLYMLPKAVNRVQQARTAERIVLVEQRFDEAPNLWSAPSLHAPLVRVSDANPQMNNYLWGSVRLISYRSRTGTPLRGLLMTPEHLEPRHKYPMLVYFYERYSDELHVFFPPAPGTTPSLVRYVSNGYVVLVPDIAYRTGHPGQSALDCVLPAVDAAVRQGFVDPSRIGISGHSWGAYQVAYIITQTHWFRAAEAGAAVANMTSAYGGIRWESGLVREFQYERDQSRIGATPWDQPGLYLENSPLFHIRNIATPYLTIHNDADGAVPWQQGLEFFTALRRLSKEAYLFVFNDEEHGLRGREQQKYWTVHLDEFFDHFLKGTPEPEWMSKGVDYLHRGERNVRPLYGESPQFGATPAPAPSAP